MFPDDSVRLLGLLKEMETARNALEILSMYVHDGDLDAQLLIPWLRILDASLTKLEVEAQIGESFHNELLALIVSQLRQRNLIVKASASNITLLDALEANEKESITWLIGQLVGSPPLQRHRTLDRLVAAIARVRKEIEAGL